MGYQLRAEEKGPGIYRVLVICRVTGSAVQQATIPASSKEEAIQKATKSLVERGQSITQEA